MRPGNVGRIAHDMNQGFASPAITSAMNWVVNRAEQTAKRGTQLSLTMFRENVDNNIFFMGNAQLSTMNKKFGSSALYLDGTSSYVKLPSVAVQSFYNYPDVPRATDFTIELWYYYEEKKYQDEVLVSWNFLNNEGWRIQIRDKCIGATIYTPRATNAKGM